MNPAGPGLDDGTVRLLDALDFPLRGSSLIEASAGTGKTYTITALYLRLILGHGGEPAAYARALTPPEILVVTFTEAATQELRDRIRGRLAEAAQVFLADPDQLDEPAPGDFLAALRASYPPETWPDHARTLRLAAEWMDEAAVSTIHGWCHRMLAEHAFDSGSLFTQALETDLRPLQAEVLRDYWRTFLTPLPIDSARQLRAWWDGPEALLAEVGKLLALHEALDAGTEPAQAIAQARAQSASRLDQIKQPWRGADGWAQGLADALDAAVAAKQCKMPKRRDWMDALRAWADGDAALPRLTATAWERLSPAGLAKDWNGDPALLAHPGWQALACVREQVQGLPVAREPILRHAAIWCGERLQQEQARRAQMGFDELLTRLDAALQGPNGPRLAELIRRQFPVALIDEFQDTDPVQYRIFDAVYGVAGNDPSTALILIGDPKQAIYAFRGADIHTYLRARQDTAGRHATLGTNFRSSTEMVVAVNSLFQRAEQRAAGQGAFLFRDGHANPLPFVPVRARGRSEHWIDAGRAAPPLTCWTLPAERALGASAAQAVMSQSCATQIVALLSAGQAGDTGFVTDDGALRALRPGDVAVLVSNGREARAIRQALGQRGVRSVYLSDKDSVFQSPVAADLQRWLAACAEPEDERLLRAALGSAALGLGWAELDRLNHDEARWEQRVEQFHGYLRRWRSQGVLPMLRQLLHDFAVPARLLQAGDERQLTDLLHLAELLQQASAAIDGEHALIRWLAEQRSGGGDSDARKLRLESDADRVKVVTVHKSKGLEYPLVFLPFATAFRPVKPNDLPLRWHDDTGRARVSLHAEPQALARADHERLGEDLRKLYVALTRARHACWIGAAPLAQPGGGALGYLLGLAGDSAPAQLNEALQDWAEQGGAVVLEPAPDANDAVFQPRRPARRLKAEPPLPRAVVPWWIASYSVLGRTQVLDEDDMAPEPAHDEQTVSGPASAREDIYADSRIVLPPVENGEPARPPAGTLHALPRGAMAGTFLHGLLEWAGQEGFGRLASQVDQRARLDAYVAQRCQASAWDSWTPVLQQWLQDWLGTPWRLPALGSPGPGAVAPAQLSSLQIEMEFWFSVQTTQTAALDALVRQHTLDGVARPVLEPRQVNGMLKGFIDLVFEHEGRYYVADYKSNWLGPTDADYGPAALREAILHHRYDLQYVLYTFALHRLLKSRLPDYDYQRHVGGAVYFFLRGHAAPSQGIHAERVPYALIEALETLFGAPVDDPEAP